MLDSSLDRSFPAMFPSCLHPIPSSNATLSSPSHGSMSTNHRPLVAFPCNRCIPGFPQGVDAGETPPRELLIARWVAEVKPGEHRVPRVRYRHLDRPAAEEWIGVPSALQHPVDDAGAHVVRIIRELRLTGGVHEEKTERIRMRATDSEQGSDAGTRLELLACPGECSLQGLHGGIEHRTVELLLRCEVPIDDFLADAGGRCHLLHPCTGKPFCRKSGRRALENRGLALGTRQKLTARARPTASGERTLHLQLAQCRLTRQQREAKNFLPGRSVCVGTMLLEMVGAYGATHRACPVPPCRAFLHRYGTPRPGDGRAHASGRRRRGGERRHRRRSRAAGGWVSPARPVSASGGVFLSPGG